VAVASAGQYVNLYLAPDRQPHQHPPLSFFTDWMPFLLSNHQHQSTEGIGNRKSNVTLIISTHMSSNPEHMVKIGPVHSRIIDLIK